MERRFLKSLNDTVRVFWRLFVGKSKIFFYFFCEMSFSFTGVNIPSYLVRAQKMDLLDYLILKVDSELLNFIMLFYSYRQHKIHYCIILTVNLLTWKKESPVFTEKQNHLFSHMTINIHLINNMGFLNFIDLSDIFDATLVKRNIVVILKNVPERENI